MLRTFDIVLIAVMTVTATVTYSIKHRAELKLDEVKRLEAEIKLERDTIDLLRADWALLTQPNRLEKLITVYAEELKLVPTDSRQIAQEMELPMLKADVPATEAAEKDGAKGAKDKATDKIATGSVKP
ncbi:hypothetical protein LJR030_005096 [Rhizobium sp. LjRoot30]|uniref:cell division protein FtsL n=1 Tax=Rhizobium sp. LjRoot30 TaxID=3342320 RepID=UPI003ECE3D74